MCFVAPVSEVLTTYEDGTVVIEMETISGKVLQEVCRDYQMKEKRPCPTLEKLQELWSLWARDPT